MQSHQGMLQNQKSKLRWKNKKKKHVTKKKEMEIREKKPSTNLL